MSTSDRSKAEIIAKLRLTQGQLGLVTIQRDELLEALHAIRKAWAVDEAHYSVEIERMIDTAIAKAEGR